MAQGTALYSFFENIFSQPYIKNDTKTAVHWRSITSGETVNLIIGSRYRNSKPTIILEVDTMNELKPRIHDEQTGLDYVLVGDYYIPDIELPEDDGHPIGKWGRMHQAYLEEANPLLLNHLILTGELHPYLADLNEQVENRYQLIVQRMAEAEGVTEDLKRRS